MTGDERWRADHLLPGLECLAMTFPDDYDGPVVATLVRLRSAAAKHGPALYVHGFIDYFFQRHMAERFDAEGYEFFALDLRKHGRSWLPDQHPNFCKSINEYYSDITRALEVIGQPVFLIGHSMGGLVSALYTHEGERRDQIRALWLNSPFFDFRLSVVRRAMLVAGASLGRVWPFLNDRHALTPDYPKSIHKDYGGEWDFDLRLKPIEGFPAYYGWLGAIRAGQARVRAGLSIACPVLSTYSDAADIVLDWRSIERGSRTLGSDVTLHAFPGGLHDLVLSREEIRRAVFDTTFAWARAAGNRYGSRPK